MTTTNTAAVETMRTAIGPLLNEFGERQWQSGRGVPHKSLEEAFDAIIERAALDAPAQPVPAPGAQLEAVGTGGWMRNGALLYRLTDERRPANFDEIRVTMANGSRDIGQMSAQAERLLVMLTAPQPAPGAPCDPSITLDFKMTTELLKMFGEEPGLVTLQQGSERSHSGTGLYAWYSDMPDEGAEFLGAEPDDEAVPDAAPAQPVAHVSQETFNDDGTSDIIVPALPIGMALYAAPQPPTSAEPTQPAAWKMDKDTFQFLSDVMTAAGLVEHGKQCKALAKRLNSGVMAVRETFQARWAPDPDQKIVKVDCGDYYQWQAAPAQAVTAKQSPHPEYDKGFSDGWNRCEARQAAAPAQAGEYPPLGKGSLWRDAEGIRGYGTDPGPGPWYTTEDVHKAINADRAASSVYSRSMDLVRVFWQQHTQADALSMTMAELHDDVELVIRAGLAAPAQPVTWPRNAAEVREFMDAHCQREERANDDSSPSDDDLYALTAYNFLSAVNSWADSPHHPGATQPAAQAQEDAHCLLREITAVAIAMLFSTHRSDVVNEFSTSELKKIAVATEGLQQCKVEKIYRRGFDLAIAAQKGDAT